MQYSLDGGMNTNVDDEGEVLFLTGGEGQIGLEFESVTGRDRHGLHGREGVAFQFGAAADEENRFLRLAVVAVIGRRATVEVIKDEPRRISVVSADDVEVALGGL